MGLAHYTGIDERLNAYLVDGYLPSKNVLISLTEQSAEAEELKRNQSARMVSRPPFSWEEWDEDSIYGNLAFNTRITFCARRPRREAHCIWSEAWLIKPNEWPPEFELKEEYHDATNRRLLVTLYEGCHFGKRCLINLVRKSELNVIPAGQYRNPHAFHQKGEALLDYISLPFRAPCLSAADRIAALGYQHEAFGK
ncbi:MAG: hypothetical protein JXC85_04470 [Candidatus Aenigmarchaeota archaeon]|nr:hypothetical protein [Candidatus Aenigmarchaeota archaeon]